MVDMSKLDPQALALLSDGTDPHTENAVVFIHTHNVPDAKQAEMLQEFGVRNVQGQQKVFTGMVSRMAMGLLSNQEFVQIIRGSAKSRPTCAVFA